MQKSKNSYLQTEFEIFEIGNSEFGIKIGIFNFELCEFGSNSIIEFLKSEFPIAISFYNIYFYYVYNNIFYFNFVL